VRKTGIVFDPIFLEHNTGSHPENSARLEAVVSTLKSSQVADSLVWTSPLPATFKQLEAVHDSVYISHIREQCLAGAVSLDADTIICRDSYEVAVMAAGAVTTAVDKVMNGDFPTAFCPVRPPGHHAESAKAMGFCLFNNIAVGARHARAAHGLGRVAIIDYDVHHGNGTQKTFYDDPSVYYVSLHQQHHYPGTGMAEERGGAGALGTNMNILMSAGDGDSAFLAKFDDDIIPALEKFEPEFIFVSSGFDAHKDDFLGGLSVTSSGYASMTRKILDLASRLGHGRVVCALEGGYNHQALAESVEAAVREMVR